MILGLDAQLVYLNQSKNTSRLKMACFQKMKIFADFNYLKKINTCGVDQEAWMLTLMVELPLFVASVSVVCWICKYPNPKGQSASMMKM
jgi:hypothetical protein